MDGVVEDLKAASPHRSLEITVDGHAWVPVMSGVPQASEENGHARVLVDASVDLAEILASARRVGEVTTFSFEPPSLTDLFLEAVSEGGRR